MAVIFFPEMITSLVCVLCLFSLDILESGFPIKWAKVNF